MTCLNLQNVALRRLVLATRLSLSRRRRSKQSGGADYEFHLGVIRETCNIVVGLAVTGGKMEFKHADRNDNIQMKRFFLNGFHQAHSSRQIAALCIYMMINSTVKILKFTFLTAVIQKMWLEILKFDVSFR